MENQELLNPGSDKEKKEQGVENLNPEQEKENSAGNESMENEEKEPEAQQPEAEVTQDLSKEEKTSGKKETPMQKDEENVEEPVSPEEPVAEKAIEEEEAPEEEVTEMETVDKAEADEVATEEKTEEEDNVEEVVTSEEPVATKEKAEEETPVEEVTENETVDKTEADEVATEETTEKEKAPETEELSSEEENVPVTAELTADIDETLETDDQPAEQKKSPEKDELAAEELKDSGTQKEEVLPAAQKSEEKAIHHDDEDSDEEEAEHDDEEGDDLATRYNSLNKEELVEAIEALVKNEDINYIRKHIGFLKVAFRNYLKEHSETEFEKSISSHDDVESNESAEHAPAAPVDKLAERFEAAFGVYRGKKYLFDQALERQKQDNLKEKEDILEELRNLIDSEEELKKTYDVFKELQEKWREIGPVPQGAKNTLWNNYHFLVEKFFDKVKINKELRDLDLRKNLEAKAELCEKAEELLLETSINKSFQKLQKLHEAWKETGPVPKDKKDEIWDRFKAASDTLNDRRQGYYDSLREEQNKNFAAKILLCEQAEQLSEFTSDSPRKWQEATNKVNELFKVWKSIGFAPKKVNDEVWVRFRTALDNFFKNKKDFFLKYKDEQTENYNQKLNLCMQAEALKDSEDWKQTTDELITLQQQWKKIGPVPKKFSDKVWKRFRAACDEFFNRKSEYFSNIGEKQDENLRKKRELIETVKTFEYSTDNNENLNTLKDFQRQWMEIGHVPIKEKDKVQNEFRKTINDQFDKLNISRRAKTTMGFRSKIENLKNSPNADNIIYKEKSFLVNKINSLQNDIKLWENNIGFFASSKKADVLKSEFEKKIEKARDDIVLLEEKLKILNQS